MGFPPPFRVAPYPVPIGLSPVVFLPVKPFPVVWVRPPFPLSRVYRKFFKTFHYVCYLKVLRHVLLHLFYTVQCVLYNLS